jgi:hypothetical protein
MAEAAMLPADVAVAIWNGLEHTHGWEATYQEQGQGC